MRKMLLAPCLVAAVGCGDPETFTDAAPGADAAEDGGSDPIDGATSPDGSGERGTVTVHVARLQADGMPDTGATVYFNDADGAFVELATPDAAGVATGMIDAGGSVTVRFSTASYPILRSVMGAQIGDELWFGPTASQGAGQMTVTVPTNAGAIRYYVVGPCATSIHGASTTINVTLATGCSATRPLLAVADRGAMADQYIVIPDATPADQSTLAITGPWVDAVAGPTATITGIPADVSTRIVNGVYFADGHQVHGMLGTLGTGEPAAATLPRPPGIDQAMTAIVRTSTSAAGYAVHVHVTPLPAAPLAIDATPRLPVLENRQSGSGGVTWTATAGVADGFYVTTAEMGSKEETLAEWDFIVPPDATGLTFPDVPDAPSTELDAITATEIDLVDGYAAYRARGATGEWRDRPPQPVPAAYVQHIAYYY